MFSFVGRGICEQKRRSMKENRELIRGRSLHLHWKHHHRQAMVQDCYWRHPSLCWTWLCCVGVYPKHRTTSEYEVSILCCSIAGEVADELVEMQMLVGVQSRSSVKLLLLEHAHQTHLQSWSCLLCQHASCWIEGRITLY